MWINFKWPLSDRTTRLLRLQAAMAGLLFLSIAIEIFFWPNRWYFGPWLVSMRSTRNSCLGLAAAITLFYATFPEWRSSAHDLVFHGSRRLHELCSRWGWGRSIMLGMVLLQLWSTVRAGVDYPRQLLSMRRWEKIVFDQPVFTDGKGLRPNIENFVDTQVDQLPQDARILFHGHIEGMLLAYEAYPRRVFMLPSELYQIASSWHVQSWLTDLPDDPLEPYWRRSFPTEVSDREQFIKDHGITHELTFSNRDISLCHLEAVK